MTINTTGAQIKPKHFSGGRRVATAESDALVNIVRGLSIDNARRVIDLETTVITDFTDNSTGVATQQNKLTDIKACTTPLSAFDGSVSGAAPQAAFATAADGFESAFAVIANWLNRTCARLGLPQVTPLVGTITTAGTIPAVTKSLTATGGGTAIDFSTGRAAMFALRNNFSTVLRQANSVLVALGYTALKDNSGGVPDMSGTINTTDTPTATAGTGTPAGTTSISDTVMDAFLNNLADNIATLAAYINDVIGAPSTTTVTDSSGGTASTALSPVLAALTLPAIVAGSATVNSPKAGFDTEIAIHENAAAELLTRLSPILGRAETKRPVDNTGSAANGTIEAMSVNLVAVDGSLGTGVEGVTGRDRLTKIAQNYSTIAAKYNLVAALYGEAQITNSLGSAFAAPTADTLQDIAATGASSAASCLLDTEVDAALVVLRNAVSTLAAQINKLIGANVAKRPLSAVSAS
jgi:hypothetical protein